MKALSTAEIVPASVTTNLTDDEMLGLLVNETAALNNGLLSKVMIDETYSHALTEHPTDAPMVRNCFASKGAYMSFQIEPGKRYLRVCIVDEVRGLIGFQIVDIVNKIAKERTCYIKDRITNIKDLLNFIRDRGYPRFKGPL